MPASAALEREAHVWTPIIESEDAPAVVDDKDRTTAAAQNRPPRNPKAARRDLSRAAVGSRRAIGRSRTNFLLVKCLPLATRRDRLPFYRLRCPRIFHSCGPTFASSAHNRGTPGGERGRELLSRGARSGLRAGSIREFARSLARTRPQQSEIRLPIPAGVNPLAVQCTTRAT
jgi:hypothetical protein